MFLNYILFCLLRTLNFIRYRCSRTYRHLWVRLFYLIWHKSLHLEMFKILSRSLILSAVILIQHFQHPNIFSDLYTELVHLHYVKLNLVRISFSRRLSQVRPVSPRSRPSILSSWATGSYLSMPIQIHIIIELIVCFFNV